jgi:hypothetical protein
VRLHELRTWLAGRGRYGSIDFSDDEHRALQDCYRSLDADGGGSISMEELTDVLVSVGVADPREVAALCGLVYPGYEGDVNDMPELDFPMFKELLKNAGSNSPLLKVLKAVLENGLHSDDRLPFTHTVSSVRRRAFLDALVGDGEKQERGQKILRNYEPEGRVSTELGADALSSSLALLWREACTGCGVPVGETKSDSEKRKSPRRRPQSPSVVIQHIRHTIVGRARLHAHMENY